MVIEGEILRTNRLSIQHKIIHQLKESQSNCDAIDYVFDPNLLI